MTVPYQSLPSAAVLPSVRAERLKVALQDRIMGLSVPAVDRIWRCILLTSGAGLVEIGDEVLPLTAPCLGWIPWSAGHSLRIRAGAVGYQLAVGDEVLVDAIGNNPESANFRYLVDRRLIASLEGEPDIAGDAEAAFDLIVRELHRPRNGSWTMMQAQVRAILVFLWRLSGIEAIAVRSHGEPSRILQRFRQLLEMHFQDRWPVGAYADAIGVSHDRLHDICRRELGKPPLQLIHERLLYEARLRLERSTLTVEQVSASLGFRDVGHFSRFFKAKADLPPGAYRARIARMQKSGAQSPDSTYADWP